MSRLSQQKNPLDFVKMAALVKKQIPEAQFLFVGDGPLRSETETFIRELNLQKAMVLAGLRKDVPELLRCMDIFTLTSLWEGLPRVIPQAMVAGLPVVATNIDGNAEIIQDGTNGFVINPGDTAGMADRVVQLLKNPELKSRLIQEIRDATNAAVMATEAGLKATHHGTRMADQVLGSLPPDVRIILVDMHAEATSEKIAMGRMLDGHVNAVIRTHTHVQTADEQIFPGRTAFLCDAGFTGPHESVLGREIEPIIRRFMTNMPQKFEVAKGRVLLQGAVVEIDEQTGRATGISRISKPLLAAEG